MPLYIFPLHRFGPETIKVDVVPRVISGGAALNGEEDVIQTDGGGRWEGTISGLSLNKPWQERLWSAWTSYWAGGARAFLMPVYSLRTAPRPSAAGHLMRPSNFVDDDDVFPTTVAFASPYIKAHTLSEVALRGTTMTVLVTQGARLEAGMRFGIGNRSYKIERLMAKGGYQATFAFSPPAREPVAVGAALNFDWPLVQCHIATGQDLAPEMLWGRRGAANFSFVEDFSDVA